MAARKETERTRGKNVLRRKKGFRETLWARNKKVECVASEGDLRWQGRAREDWHLPRALACCSRSAFGCPVVQVSNQSSWTGKPPDITGGRETASN
jgi:hypothetical protein